jgi:hypothetical protein
MATKKKATKGTAWMDDHDDAHFPDNPAVAHKVHNRKKNGKKHATVKGGTAGSKKIVGGLAKVAIAAKKPVNHKKSHKRVAGK